MAIILIRLVLSTSGLLEMIKTKQRSLRIKTKKNEALFDQYFIEPRNFYTKVFKTVPCVAFIRNIDAQKIFEKIKD